MRLQDWPWKPDPDYTRLLKPLRRQGVSGRVPFLELFADSEIIADVLGESVFPRETKDRRLVNEGLDQRIRFWYQLGYDAIWQGAVLDLPDMVRLASDDTAPLARPRRRWVDEGKGIVASWQDFEQYPWPSAAEADLHAMERAARSLPDGMAIIAALPGVLESVMWLMGYETFALALYDQTDLVEAMFSRIAEIVVPLARTLVQMDRVVALWMGDDMGFKTETMISPAHLRRFVFPIHKRVAAMAHEQGMPFLLHSCGNLDAIMEDLIECVGIDAKHSFEDVIEPVESFVGRYGDRVAAVGGVDLDILARGTEEQVRSRTRAILDACGCSGNYVLGSGNSVANYVPVRNFLAMVDEGWRYNARNT